MGCKVTHWSWSPHSKVTSQLAWAGENSARGASTCDSGVPVDRDRAGHRHSQVAASDPLEWSGPFALPLATAQAPISNRSYSVTDGRGHSSPDSTRRRWPPDPRTCPRTQTARGGAPRQVRISVRQVRMSVRRKA